MQSEQVSSCLLSVVPGDFCDSVCVSYSESEESSYLTTFEVSQMCILAIAILRDTIVYILINTMMIKYF